EILKKELASYPVPEGQIPLLERPQLVALNKIDVPEARDMAEFVRADLEKMGYRVFLISTVSREGLRELGFALGDIVEQARAKALAEATEKQQERVVLRPKSRTREAEFEIKVEGSTYGTLYRVLGTKPERWVAQTDFTNDEAIGYLADRLNRIGVEDGLVKAGAVAGSAVVIGPGEGVVFDWEPTMTSAAEVQIGARGSDLRIDQNERRTNKERRQEYYEWMDAKAAARAELQQEREAGLWQETDAAADESEQS
ncbi:MAG: Obg family GTPase CgtA, partial [Microbacteriaceae bacterium]|nr:Obg family GTPase CgtA [Microbacteriaceae bacterium]